MASIPIPRSYTDILGDEISGFVSRFGIKRLKIGSPVLSILEAVAQSQLRNSEDVFTLLEASSLDQATGLALDRIGLDESLPRRTENAASGVVAIEDTSFTKISSKIFQGTPAPIIGSQALNIVDASAYPSSGSVYIGRGTSNFEGPIAYSSKTFGGNYWTLALSTGTLRFHNTGEPVTVAQGGDRTISAGTIIQTPQGNASNATQFKTLYSFTIPDGETGANNISVVCTAAGVIGNIPAEAISGFASAPFTGATVTNTTPYINGNASETDENYRERIRQARQSRARGTALAIETFATGITSPDENKQVLSASLVQLPDLATLYIDDGTGYEEITQGVALESFTDYANGGEYFFKIATQPPVSKAFLLSAQSAPYALSSGMQLAFSAGGVETAHTFDATEFRAIGNADVYEVVASINGNPALNWSARTSDSGTRVVVFAKADTNESVETVAVSNDANSILQFPSGRVDTMRLYKNDRLLNKDGAIAAINSKPFAQWGILSGPQSLAITVDNIDLAFDGTHFDEFTDADFINAGTSYTTLGNNSPEAWAQVFNYRIPGITASVISGVVNITSNRGTSSRAGVTVVGGSLVTNGMFPTGLLATSTGSNSDYILNRNTGEIKLASPLQSGDYLDAGSLNTRAFLQSSSFPSLDVTDVNGGNLWFAIDGLAQIVPTGVTASTALNFTSTTKSWGKRWRVTQNVGTGLFANLAVGDWAIFWDSATPSAFFLNSYRVTTVDTATSSWFEFESTLSPSVSNPYTLTNAGLVFVRTSAALEQVNIPQGNQYTATSLRSILQSALPGTDVNVFRTTALRLNTATFGLNTGDIAAVAADVNGQELGLPIANATVNIAGHLASVESGNTDLGTPTLGHFSITNNSGAVQPHVTWTADLSAASPPVWSQIVGLNPIPDGGATTDIRYGQNHGVSSSIAQITGGPSTFNLTLNSNPEEWMLGDRVYFAYPFGLASDDSLAVLVDEDSNTKNFTVPMWRTLSTVGSTYGSTNTFRDADDGNQSLAIGFGSGATGFTFNDFAVFMAARVKTHNNGDATHYTSPPSDFSQTILWRYYRLGPDGNNTKVSYGLPTAASQAVSIAIDNLTDDYTNVSILLGSGALKTGYQLAANNKVGVVVTSSASGVSHVSYLIGIASTQAESDGTNVILTLDLTPSGANNHNIQVGDFIYARNNNGTFPDGYYQVTAVTSTTVSYATAILAIGPIAIAGSVSVGASEATLSGSSPVVAAGDFFRVENTSLLGSNFVAQTMRIDTLPDNFTIKGVLDKTISVNLAVTWAYLGDVSAFKIFANLNQTSSSIVTAVNALANTPIKGTVIGSGTGIINKASYAEAASNTAQWFDLVDGINYVKTTTVPGSPSGDYQFTFKNSVNSNLTTNSDWNNEVVKVVPRTTKNVVEWMNEPTVSGLFSVAAIERSSRAHKVQIASNTPGSMGSVYVQGGTANSTTTAIVGSAAQVSDTMLVQIRAIDLSGFMANTWVSIDNTASLPKAGIFTSSSTLQSIAINNPSNGLNLLHITSANLYTGLGSATASGLAIIEKQGNFVAISDTGLGTAFNTTSIVEGCWVRLKTPATNTYFGQAGYEAVARINASNVGIFRVVRVANGVVWIENPIAVEQRLAEFDVQFFTYSSIVPGDYISISTSLWDGTASNQGTFKIIDVGNNGGGSFTNSAYLTVQGDMSAVGSSPGALGTSRVNQVQIVEGTPSRLIKEILGIAPNSTSTLADIKFTTSAGYQQVGNTPGSVITVLDKLNFPTSVANGMDGYRRSTGLIGAVNQVLYGDPSDPDSYPGVIAAGANIDISGPLVRRIQVTLAIRTKSNSSLQDIEDFVKSAVAAVINEAGVGQSISLSDLTTAAGQVIGVVTATMVNPLATSSNDLIVVQPNEKPAVLNIDEDISVSFVGDL